MPELPEVETVRRGLKKLILNKKIIKVDLPYKKLVNGNSKKFVDQVTGQKFIDIDRRGKFLYLRLSNDQTIISHLRMEGKYSVEELDVQPFKQTEAIFYFSDSKLFYTDTRRFGKMQLVETGEETQAIASIQAMGPEPTKRDLKTGYLIEELKKSNKMIKPWLLDQSNVAGVGNIYADEILWLSKIHPETLTNKLTDKQIETLRENIIEELALGIKYGGSTVHSFKSSDGKTGRMQDHLHVYGKVGQLCERADHTPLVKIKVAQRGTTYCPYCQKPQ